MVIEWKVERVSARDTPYGVWPFFFFFQSYNDLSFLWRETIIINKSTFHTKFISSSKTVKGVMSVRDLASLCLYMNNGLRTKLNPKLLSQDVLVDFIFGYKTFNQTLLKPQLLRLVEFVMDGLIRRTKETES